MARKTRTDIVTPPPKSTKALHPAAAVAVLDPQPNQPKPPIKFIGKAAMCLMVGKTYPTIWKWMQEGSFPRARNTGGTCSWIESEVQEWMKNRPVQSLKGDDKQKESAS